MNEFERLSRQQKTAEVRHDESDVVRQNAGWTRRQFSNALRSSLGLQINVERSTASEGYCYRKYLDGVATEVASDTFSAPRTIDGKQETWILERGTPTQRGPATVPICGVCNVEMKVMPTNGVLSWACEKCDWLDIDEEAPEGLCFVNPVNTKETSKVYVKGWTLERERKS